MCTVPRANMRAHTADIDDAPPVPFQRRQTGMHTSEGAIEDNIHYLAPIGIAHIADGLFAAQRCIVDQEVDPTEVLERRMGEHGSRYLIANIAKHSHRLRSEERRVGKE